ncbi:hypothetical protein UlMin_035101 [Ulmus minor]
MFYHEEPTNHSKKCKFLAACLKDAFSNCHNFGRLSPSNPEEDYPASDFDDEEEVVVSAIRSGAIEKLRKKPIFLSDSFSWVYSPVTGELYLTPNGGRQREKQEEDEEDDEVREEFLSVKSCLSCCSSGLSRDVFLSVKTSFSRCSSLSGFELNEFQRRSIIQQFCHCEGWPFGLGRKAVLLPPLPKSPSESWSWRKGTRMVKIT